jgi:hypothetical protein
MATDVRAGTEQPNSVTGLVSGIITDAQELFKQQVALLRHEVREDLRKTRDASLALGAGIGILGLGVLFFLTAAALLIARAGLPVWAGFGIVAVVLIAAGLVAFFVGKKKFDSFNPLPAESAEALKENVQWITNPKT